ncbi:MAG: hypothetical protein C0467_17775 [Planctomycetaceae bacterium]|nr:hypothetical protein [Planctomycetaceae bacterium]
MSKFITIDLDAQGIFVVSGTARVGHAKVEQALAWVGTEAEGGPPTLRLETARHIGEQLRERLKAAGIAQAPVMVGVSRDRVVLKELRYPQVPPTDEPSIVRFQALKELSDAPEDVVLDYVPLAGESPTGEQRSIAVVIRKDLYRSIQQMCEVANLRLIAVTPRPYALAAGLTRAFTTSTVQAPDSKTDAVGLLTIAPGGGEFTVTCAGEVVFTRSVAGPVMASEAMLLNEVRRNLTMYAGAHPGHPVQALYIAEADGTWAGRLRAALGIPVYDHDPLTGEVPTVSEELRGRFAGAAGLLAARTVGDPPINFVEPRQPKPEADPARKQILIAVLAALVFFGGGALLGFVALSAADTEVELKTKQRDDSKKQWETLEAEGKRLAAAEAWKSRGVVWLDELYDMSDRFPVAGGFHATSFTGKALPPDPKTGKQESQAAIEVKVTAKNPEPVNQLLGFLEGDSVDPAPKNPKGAPRFYVGADKTIGGPSQGEAGARDYTVFARVNNRPTDKFIRTASFPPPSRKGYPPATAGKEPSKEKDKDRSEVKESKDAPMPRPKESDGKE